MKKTVLALCFVMICSTITAQILRVATSQSAIATQIPGFSEVTTIAIKTYAYTPSVATSAPTPIDEDTTTEENKL